MLDYCCHADVDLARPSPSEAEILLDSAELLEHGKDLVHRVSCQAAPVLSRGYEGGSGYVLDEFHCDYGVAVRQVRFSFNVDFQEGVASCGYLVDHVTNGLGVPLVSFFGCLSSFDRIEVNEWHGRDFFIVTGGGCCFPHGVVCGDELFPFSLDAFGLRGTLFSVVGAFEDNLLIAADGANYGDHFPAELTQHVDVSLETDRFLRDGNADFAEELHLGENGIGRVNIQHRVVEVGGAVADDQVLPLLISGLGVDGSQKHEDREEQCYEGFEAGASHTQYGSFRRVRLVRYPDAVFCSATIVSAPQALFAVPNQVYTGIFTDY